jgi:4-amino-4-deoxy-L-arabinose transferase-like glycosyltransferase
MEKKYKALFIILYIFVTISIVIMSSVPPTSRDAQTHHLALPKIWLSQGLLAEVPDMEFSYYPQLVDLLYTLPVSADFDIAAKYIHFIFALATALLIIFFIRRYLGLVWGLLGGLMFLTIPVIIKLSVTVYVDLGLLFFFTASLFSAIIWLENTNKLKWLLISGFCSGLALSTKYNAMLSVTILAILIIYFYLKTRDNKYSKQLSIIKYISFFSLIALLIYSPWLIRNYKLTDNPVYPLYNSFFAKFSDNEKLIKEEVFSGDAQKTLPLTKRRILYNENLPYILALPVRVFYEGQDDEAQFFDGKLNPFLLLFSLLLVINKKLSWKNQFMVLFVSLNLLYTMLAADMRIRYIITIVSPMVVLSVFGLYKLQDWLQKKYNRVILRTILMILVSCFFVYNISYGVKLFYKIDPMSYISGEVSREQYLAKYVPHYKLNQVANDVVSKDNKLLGVYLGNRRYYIDVPVTLESDLIYKIARDVNNADELSEELRKYKISHILVRLDLFNNQLSYKDNNTKRIVTQFFSTHVKLLGSEEVFGLYEIL